MNHLALHPDEITIRRANRARRLALVDIPTLRVIGLAFLSLGVYLNNRYILGEPSLASWAWITGFFAVYCVASWLVIRALYGKGRLDVSFAFLVIDLVVWTIAIYASGAERSWLSFILLMRVADQTVSNFRRCLGFALFGTFCYAAMMLWVVVVDGRTIPTDVALVRVLFVLLTGVYIALSARTAERRRHQMSEAIRVSRELIRKQDEQSVELREARAKAEQASAAKSEFLANMSHEMRTPLHGVIGMLQLAVDDEESPRRLRQLEMARRSAESLLGTIDDLLDFSRIEARKIDLEPIYFSLRDVLMETMKPLGVTAAAKDLVLAVGIAPDLPDTVWGDPVRVKQVLINLVANAIKFTEKGEISVQVESGDRVMRFEVRDTGMGIPEDQRERVFEPFAQADTSTSRRYGGTGLGLAIVARLVDAMGGKIELLSEPGGGSCFSFALPLPADGVGSRVTSAGWEDSLRSLRMLVIDGNETSREFIADILRSRGIVAVTCASAAEIPAGRFACAISSDESILIEPAIIITSPLEHISDDRVRLTRPVGERELVEALGTIMKMGSRPASAGSVERPRRAGALRVLVAEDNLIAQEFAAEALRRLGHSIALASDGNEALTMLRREIFDLVLMDVQMPSLDGLEVTRRYREREAKGVRTPIVALTAHFGREDRERCIEAGMDAVLTKPIDLRQLETVVRSVTGIEPIVQAVGGNMKLLARVSDAFAKQTPTLIAAMKQAIAAKDADLLSRTAHTMKGAVINFDGDPSLDLSLMMEAAAREGDFTRAAGLMARLEGALAALERRITAAMAET